jgi:hypothetical protein
MHTFLGIHWLWSTKTKINMTQFVSNQRIIYDFCYAEKIHFVLYVDGHSIVSVNYALIYYSKWQAYYYDGIALDLL